MSRGSLLKALMLFLATALTLFTTVAWSVEGALPLDALFAFPGHFGIANAYSVAIGDFNHDGRSDVVVADRFGKLHILSQTDRGEFTATAEYSAKYSAPEHGNPVVVVDVNGDGRDDLLVGNDDGIDMLLQNASGALDEPEHVVGSLPSAEFLCVGNFDGDGRQDIAAMGNGQLNLYLQKPGGGLNEPVQTPLAGLVWDCKVSDVNGDGRDDLVILPYSIRETIVLIALQKETGGFEDIRTMTWEGIQGRWDAIQAATAIAVGDFNGDGRVDFALGPRLNLLFQLEDGSFAPVLLQIGEGLVIPAAGIGHNDARAIEAADVNGDGLLDLIAATASNTGSTSLPSYLLSLIHI